MVASRNNRKKKRMNSSARAIKEGYSGGNSHFRSGLEESNADYLEGKGFLSPSYEEMTLYYLPEIVPKRYTPDFIFEKKADRRVLNHRN